MTFNAEPMVGSWTFFFLGQLNMPWLAKGMVDLWRASAMVVHGGHCGAIISAPLRNECSPACGKVLQGSITAPLHLCQHLSAAIPWRSSFK
jgi:hypothetical protein